MDARKLRSGVLLAALVLGATATSDAAENWPERSVRLLVPFASGSSPDVAARLYADRLARAWHQPVIVENRPGAEGLVCAAAFAGMRNDHALLFSPAAPISVFPFTHASLGYDPTPAAPVRRFFVRLPLEGNIIIPLGVKIPLTIPVGGLRCGVKVSYPSPKS